MLALATPTLLRPSLAQAQNAPTPTPLFQWKFTTASSFAATVSGYDAHNVACWRSVNGAVNPYQNIDHLNQESERYTPSTASNSPFSVAKGVLNMTAPAGSGPTWPSGLINSVTQPGGVFKSGRLEVEALLPLGTGLWPAIWLLPQDAEWPGEIDIVEQLGQKVTDWYATTGLIQQGKQPKTSVIYQSEHEGPNGVDTPAFTQPVFITGDTSQKFHTYGLDFGPKQLIYYIDGVETWRCTTPPRLVTNLSKGMYLIVNLALGGRGSWSGQINPKVLPATMSIRAITLYPQGSAIPLGDNADTAPMLYNTTYMAPGAYVPAGFKAGPTTTWAGD